MAEKITFELTGRVQGVGFRPAIYRLAVAAKLGGWVKNCPDKVEMCLEGSQSAINEFMESLPLKIPPAAKLEKIKVISSDTVPDPEISQFSITASSGSGRSEVLIPADLAMCPDCEREILDPSNRRYLYPFTTCTACGPRYTVIDAMPYDRERTTLREFPLCPECRAEYENPLDRRFHAESTACPVCGPELFLADSDGNKIESKNPIAEAVAAISDGKILALRGIGGFQLAVNALDASAITRLREVKKRPHKPFAVMMPEIDTVKKYCRVSETGIELLKSTEAPIVILDLLPDLPENFPVKLLSPDIHTLGVMLPYTPLHKLIFELSKQEDSGFEVLVMTSGNRRAEPICIGNSEAIERLGDIADVFLLHNREINLRNDDSLVSIQSGRPQIWRRARGYAPNPVRLSRSMPGCVLAMGAELKNTITLAWGDQAVISPHIGDLETPEALAGLEQVCECLPRFLERRPKLIAVDLHPDMHATCTGLEMAEILMLPTVSVQHHHAHAAAALEEHNIENCLALVFDGTGYGTDGSIWGAELLDASREKFRRIATFTPALLPGGDAATIQPVRQLAARLYHAGIDLSPEWLKRMKISGVEASAWTMQCQKQLNTPFTHAAGRLFDAFAALLGLADGPLTYEAQAPIRLETLAGNAPGIKESLEFDAHEEEGLLMIDWNPLFWRFSDPEKIPEGPALAETAMAFHNAVADAAVTMLEYGLSNSSRRNVVLSGGTFMNRILTRLMLEKTAGLDVKVFVHREIPPNDGGISFGQAVVAGACFSVK